MKLLILLSLLTSAIFAQGEIKDAGKILKHKDDTFLIGAQGFLYSVDAVMESDFKKRNLKAGLKQFASTCLKIENLINSSIQKAAGTSLDHVQSYVDTIDHGKMGKQHLCYLYGDTRNNDLTNKEISFKYYSTPIFSGETGKEDVLKDCSNLKYTLRKNQEQTGRIAVHDRIEDLRTSRGRKVGNKIYKCQVMWTTIDVVSYEEPKPACIPGSTYKVSIAPSALKSWNHLSFPYFTDTVPVRPLGYYDSKAYNHHKDKSGKIGSVSVRNIIEEKQVPFVFNTNRLPKRRGDYELTGAKLKGSFIKSLKTDGKNPRFNDTEMICHMMGHNFCSGRKFRGDWAKYLNPEFWSQSQIVNHDFSDLVVKAYKDGKNGLPTEYAEVNIDVNAADFWGAGTIDHFKGLVKAGHDITVVLTDDMWVTPDQTELELEFTCK